MSDLIDRGQAMDAIIDYGKYLWERFHEPCHLAGMLNAIENVPSAQRWIPVTEQLPEDGKYVLAYSADDDFMTVEARRKFEAFQITHWMPLPEPYQEGENQ